MTTSDNPVEPGVTAAARSARVWIDWVLTACSIGGCAALLACVPTGLGPGHAAWVVVLLVALAIAEGLALAGRGLARYGRGPLELDRRPSALRGSRWRVAWEGRFAGVMTLVWGTPAFAAWPGGSVSVALGTVLLLLLAGVAIRVVGESRFEWFALAVMTVMLATIGIATATTDLAHPTFTVAMIVTFANLGLHLAVLGLRLIEDPAR